MTERKCLNCEYFVVVQFVGTDGALQHQPQCWYNPPRTSVMVRPPHVVGGPPTTGTVTIRDETQPDTFCGHFVAKPPEPMVIQ